LIAPARPAPLTAEKSVDLRGETVEESVWTDLAELIKTPICDDVPLRLVLIDSGFRPGKRVDLPLNRIYDFCRRFHRFVRPTKGSCSRWIARPALRATSQTSAASWPSFDRQAMSGSGQTLPNQTFRPMSGLPPVATELRTCRIGSFVPIVLQKSQNAVRRNFR
jgi:hypothetical protein